MVARPPSALRSSTDGREIRAAIWSGAVRGGASQDRAWGLTLAAWEAARNAVEHGGGQPEITIGVACDRVTVRITDRGACDEGLARGGWSMGEPDPWASRGRGMRMIDALVDEVRISEADDAVYVELTIRLPG